MAREDEHIGDTRGDDPRVGTTLRDRYELVLRIGKDEVGILYEGDDLLDGVKVCVRCLDPSLGHSPGAVARYHEEALAASAIGNSRIAAVLDTGQERDGTWFTVEEKVDGRRLSDVLAETGPMPLGRALTIVSRACDGLAAAHEGGILHRGLKPSSLVIVPGDEHGEDVKLLGFGFAKLEEDEEGALTITGTTIGAPDYMSPEQIHSTENLDFRADIYSMGVLAYQMLAGRLPFAADSFPMILVRIAHDDPAPLSLHRPELPPEIEQIVAAMLAKTPAERPKSCRAVAEALAPFVDSP